MARLRWLTALFTEGFAATQSLFHVLWRQPPAEIPALSWSAATSCPRFVERACSASRRAEVSQVDISFHLFVREFLEAKCLETAGVEVRCLAAARSTWTSSRARSTGKLCCTHCRGPSPTEHVIKTAGAWWSVSTRENLFNPRMPELSQGGWTSHSLLDLGRQFRALIR